MLDIKFSIEWRRCLTLLSGVTTALLVSYSAHSEASASSDPASTPPTTSHPGSAPADSAAAPPAAPTADAPTQSSTDIAPLPDVKPKPPPYSLPWQLRPAAPGNVVRSDTAIAFYKSPAGDSGTTVASMLLASYKVTPEIAPFIRLGIETDSPPTTPAGPPPSGTAFLNPLLGAMWGIKPSPETRLAASFAFTLPVGGGGGDTPDPAAAASLGKGAAARSYFDNAMFAVNYLTLIPGVDFAYVAGGFTAQAEVTLFELVRTRGSAVPANVDSARTNLTSGVHLGYFLVPELSLGVELRYQRWLKNTTIPDDAPPRDNLTFAGGVRGHFKLSDSMWLRPGIAYARGLDNPMSDAKYNIVQIDVPFVF